MRLSHPMSLLLCALILPACAQPPQAAPSPRPDTPGAAQPSAQEQLATADGHMKAMQAIHQRLMAARTPQERRALMAEHSRAMRSAMTAMEGMQHGPMRRGPGMAGPHVHEQLAMMQVMMRMMMDRIDLLSDPTR